MRDLPGFTEIEINSWLLNAVPSQFLRRGSCWHARIQPYTANASSQALLPGLTPNITSAIGIGGREAECQRRGIPLKLKAAKVAVTLLVGELGSTQIRSCESFCATPPVQIGIPNRPPASCSSSAPERCWMARIRLASPRHHQSSRWIRL